MERSEDRVLTPKKVVSKANERCRICKCSFLVKYGTGKSGRMSTENLFEVSNRDGSRGQVLATMCEQIGIHFVKLSSLSSRVCNSCARKIRNLFRLFEEVKSATNFESSVETGSSPARIKRQLPTTVSTPDRSPSSRKVSRANTKSTEPSSRKSLFSSKGESLEESSEPSCSGSVSVSNRSDLLLHHMNLNDLVGNNETMVKVVTVYPSGEVDVRTPADKKSKNLVRNVVLKNWKAVANGMFGHDAVREELPGALERAVASEFKEYSRSDSVLKGTEPDQLAGFSAMLVLEEVKVFCPLWSASIHGACGKRSINSIALCSSVAARVRNAAMSAMAYRISAVLFHAGVGYDDLRRLNRMGVSMSPDRLINLQRKMGEHFDAKVYVWKEAIEKNRRTLAFLEEVEEQQVPKFEVDDMAVETHIDLAENTVKTYKRYQPETLENAIQLTGKLQLERQDASLTDDTLRDAINHLKQERLPLFKIVGDNVDLEVRARIQTKEHGNQSLHWTHQYAELARVVNPTAESKTPQRDVKDVQLIELLPSEDVLQSLKKTWSILISRVLCKYIGVLKDFKDVVIYHIPHEYSEEMVQKSHMCCLDLYFWNPNIAGEMAQILKANQEKYVPVDCKDEEREVLTRIGQHGDQLFEERGRNVQWAFGDGGNQYDRLEGLRTEFADWHAKVTLYETEFETFVKAKSAGEIGTSAASINRTGKTNARKGVHSHYNEYKEFHEREIEGHICAAFMEMSSMTKLEDQPSYDLPDKSVSKATRQKWLLELCEQLVGRFIFGESEVQTLVEQTQILQETRNQPIVCRAEDCHATYVQHSRRVRHEIETHGRNFNRILGERDEFGYFYCRAGCENVFLTKATRNRHEKDVHEDAPAEESEEIEEGPARQDYLYNYHKAKLTYGLILFEFNDAIKEGDGERLFKLYKLALLLYKVNGHTKYAYVVLLYMCQIIAILPESEASDLKHNRFHNKYGGKGNNIPLDLLKEQLHKDLKTMWKGLGSNLSEESASRIAKALEMLQAILKTVDKDCALETRKGYRSAKSPEESVKQILGDLMQKSVFKFTPGREGHPTFHNFDGNLLKGLDYRDLHKWMTEHQSLWGSIYEGRSS